MVAGMDVHKQIADKTMASASGKLSGVTADQMLNWLRQTYLTEDEAAEIWASVERIVRRGACQR